MTSDRNLSTNKADREERVFSCVPHVLKTTNFAVLPQSRIAASREDSSCCSSAQIKTVILHTHTHKFNDSHNINETDLISALAEAILHNLPSAPDEREVLSLPQHSATLMGLSKSTETMGEFRLQNSQELTWARKFLSDRPWYSCPKVAHEQPCFLCYPCEKWPLLFQRTLLRNEDLTFATSVFQINSQASFKRALALTQFLQVTSTEVLQSCRLNRAHQTPQPSFNMTRIWHLLRDAAC